MVVEVTVEDAVDVVLLAGWLRSCHLAVQLARGGRAAFELMLCCDLLLVAPGYYSPCRAKGIGHTTRSMGCSS